MPQRAADALISTVEASYDLEKSESEWLSRVVDASLPILDRGFGAAGWIVEAPTRAGPQSVAASHVAAGAHELTARFCAAIEAIFGEAVPPLRSGPWILSELEAKELDELERWPSQLDGANDATGIAALDTGRYELHLIAASPAPISLTRTQRDAWQMLAAHLSAGLRLRRALLKYASSPRERSPTLPHGAEAVIAPQGFRIVDATAPAQKPSVLDSLREAAIRTDRARTKGRRSSSPEEALSSWHALVRGRHSLVDWFDADGRRYILAIPNPPGVRDIRGLTEREARVVQYVALGEKHRTIGYRLGISRSAVTKAVGSAMRKLGAKTSTELVARIAPLLRSDEP
jgi:DNA-binding CsgD family transcriptional regulator